jgi:hypothetical protein
MTVSHAARAAKLRSSGFSFVTFGDCAKVSGHSSFAARRLNAIK